MVGRRIDLDDLERGYNRRIGGNGVKTDVGFAVSDECEEIGVKPKASEILRPGGAVAEDDGAFDGDLEARRMRLAVVIVVDGEGAEEEARGRGRGGRGSRDWDKVAILLAGGGGREEADGFLGEEVESERLGDDGCGSAGEVAVGEPGNAVLVDGGGGAAAIYVDGQIERIGEREGTEDEEREGEEEKERHGDGGRKNGLLRHGGGFGGVESGGVGRRD